VGHAYTVLHVCALSVDLQIPSSSSLKAKRTVVKHLVETAKSRFGVAAAEIGTQEQWQRSELGFAAVAGTPGHVEEVLDSVERFVWSHPEITVLRVDRSWLESDT
jgi:uncharacterized protein